jgi:hypothetical protein
MGGEHIKSAFVVARGDLSRATLFYSDINLSHPRSISPNPLP